MADNIRIEVLFPEFANLFGDLQSIHYLQECIPDAEVLHTALYDEPVFTREPVTMVYMGAMTESQQELAVEALRPHKETIERLIEDGTIFLFTSNAMELFGQYIEKEDGTKIEGLGLFPIYAKRDMMHRYSSLVYGEFEGMKIVGFKAQFAHCYGDNSGCYFFDVTRGPGINPESKYDGLRKNNFFATSCVGPFLIFNPPFTRYLLTQMGVEQPQLAYEETAMAAFNERIKDFENKDIQFRQ